jgi:hypothetical protein
VQWCNNKKLNGLEKKNWKIIGIGGISSVITKLAGGAHALHMQPPEEQLEPEVEVERPHKAEAQQ